MKRDIFAYANYKEFLSDWLHDPQRGGGHGSRAKIAEAIGCQKSYVAQVLNGTSHFSLEQIEAINDFIGHNEQEGRFLVCLLLYERAGSSKVRERFKKQIDEILEARNLLKNRIIAGQPLSLEHQLTHYSAWYYSAIHVLASQKRFSSPNAIAQYLGLSPIIVNEALTFLTANNFIETTTNGYTVGKKTIHLGSDSPLISRHHSNWRMQALRSLERGHRDDLHYSSINTLSKRDVKKIKSFLMDSIKEAQEIIRESPEEEIQCISIDFFGV